MVVHYPPLLWMSLQFKVAEFNPVSRSEHPLTLTELQVLQEGIFPFTWNKLQTQVIPLGITCCRS